METSAPDGYSLLPQPFPVELTATGNENALRTATADIQNVKPMLALTCPWRRALGSHWRRRSVAVPGFGVLHEDPPQHRIC